MGFHSNDARGVNTTVDSGANDALTENASPLVRTKGAEIGVRTTYIPGLQSTTSLWVLDSDSELVFIGDAGNTEPSRPSRRYGVEFANYYRLNRWIGIDADYSLSHAEFRGSDPDGAGNQIPGSIEQVLSAGVSFRDPKGGLFGSVRMRYFGPRPLIEDGSVYSADSTLFNAEVGYQFNETWTLKAEILNVFDKKKNDIEYYYASRLGNEPAGPDDGGYNDRHIHPAEPFEFRIGVTARF